MDIGWKAVDFAAMAFAGIISDNIVKLGWKAATGHNPPEDDDLEANLAELVVFAVISAGLMAVARRFTVRSAAKWYGNKYPQAKEV